jgi:hypothetical protein
MALKRSSGPPTSLVGRPDDQGCLAHRLAARQVTDPMPYSLSNKVNDDPTPWTPPVQADFTYTVILFSTSIDAGGTHCTGHESTTIEANGDSYRGGDSCQRSHSGSLHITRMPRSKGCECLLILRPWLLVHRSSPPSSSELAPVGFDVPVLIDCVCGVELLGFWNSSIRYRSS